MAKNYTFSEAVEIIAKGTDLEAIAELGKRFPVLSVKIATVAAKAGESFVDLMGYMPEHLTANKVNTVIKSGITETAEDADEEANDVDVADEETTGTDYDSMSGKELVKLLRKAGKGKLITSKKKADLVELCKKELGGSTTDEVEEDVDTEENPYEGKTAQELFKECKRRGLKAEAKKSAKFYADILMKDDAKAENDAEDDDWEDEEETPKTEKKADKKSKKAAKKVEAEDEDEDWEDEDEDEAPKAKKEEKKSSKKAEKKSTKKAEPEDDDEDWDI